MIGTSDVVKNAADVPVSTVNEATAAITSDCSLSNSRVSFRQCSSTPMTENADLCEAGNHFIIWSKIIQSQSANALGWLHDDASVTIDKKVR